MTKNVMIIAPFWGHFPHLGNIRVDRFVRWLSAQGVHIIMVRAGLTDEERETPWGFEITIRDPLGKWGRPVARDSSGVVARPPSRYRTYITEQLFNPDMTVMWAHRLVRHPLVVKHGQNLAWVLASNPPESGHWAAYRLADQFSTALIVDMRDGWLDGPIKAILQSSRFKHWREDRLEQRILQRAQCVFVVTEGLKKMMVQRRPFTQDKITLLTNAYPPGVTAASGEKPRWTDISQINLLYAGRFTGSQHARKGQYLLEPLLAGIRRCNRQGKIALLGDFGPNELKDIASRRPTFEAAQWTLEVQPAVPREEAILKMNQTDGLLFLTESSVVLSAKLFEYLATGRPILAITPEDGDVWNACIDLPQVFLIPLSAPESALETVEKFLNACAQPAWPYQIPAEFTEAHLSKVFLQAVGMSGEQIR